MVYDVSFVLVPLTMILENTFKMGTIVDMFVAEKGLERYLSPLGISGLLFPGASGSG